MVKKFKCNKLGLGSLSLFLCIYSIFILILSVPYLNNIKIVVL
ncbi:MULTISPECIES: hypothetical protein [Clostridium]|nr:MULTISPECIES: hypothetical protein [Clostridium]